MSKIALQMYTMRNHTGTFSALSSTLEKLRKIGYENIQYTIPENFDTSEVKKLTEDLGIKVISSA